MTRPMKHPHWTAVATRRELATATALSVCLAPALLAAGFLLLLGSSPSEPCHAGQTCGLDPLWALATGVVVGGPSAGSLAYAWLASRPSPISRIRVLGLAVLVCVGWVLVTWLALSPMATPQP
ncbi:MAG: hypothetical protein JWP48_1789 [Actinoallomurus sp.]|jgi:hypothetical protein|nr:hypothetical protein [Actinoallomurus sp.]